MSDLNDAIDKKLNVEIGPKLVEYTGAPLTAARIWSDENFMKNLASFWNQILKHPNITTKVTLHVQPDKKELVESMVVNFDFQDGNLTYAVLKGASPDKARKGIILMGEPKHWAKVFSKGELKAVKHEFDLQTFGMDEMQGLHLLLHSAMALAKDYHFMSPKDIDKSVKSTR